MPWTANISYLWRVSFLFTRSLGVYCSCVSKIYSNSSSTNYKIYIINLFDMLQNGGVPYFVWIGAQEGLQINSRSWVSNRTRIGSVWAEKMTSTGSVLAAWPKGMHGIWSETGCATLALACGAPVAEDDHEPGPVYMRVQPAALRAPATATRVVANSGDQLDR